MHYAHSSLEKMSLAALARKLNPSAPNEEFLEMLSQADVAALQARVRENANTQEYRRARLLRAPWPWLALAALLCTGAWFAVSAASPLIQALTPVLAGGLVALAHQVTLRVTLESVGPQRVLEATLIPLRFTPAKHRALEAACSADVACREHCETVDHHGRELLAADFYLLDLKMKGALSAVANSPKQGTPPKRKGPSRRATASLRTPAPPTSQLPPAERPVYVWRNSQMAA